MTELQCRLLPTLEDTVSLLYRQKTPVVVIVDTGRRRA
jgi:hypothetical protein